MSHTSSPATGLRHNNVVPQRLRELLKQSAARLSICAVGLLLPLAILGLWQAAVNHEWIAVQLLPPPSLVWQTFFELLDSGELASHLAISLQRVGLGVLFGSLIGWALGFLIGLSKTARAYLYPGFEVFSQFPVIGWIPLLIIFLGIDEGLKVAAIALAVIVPVTIATYKGIDNIPPRLLEVARVYRFTPGQLLLRLVLPAALPSLFSGFRQGIMQAWLTLVFVELLTAGEGIGYLMAWGRMMLQDDLIFVGLIVIGSVGVLLDLGLRRVEKHLQAWQPQQ